MKQRKYAVAIKVIPQTLEEIQFNLDAIAFLHMLEGMPYERATKQARLDIKQLQRRYKVITKVEERQVSVGSPARSKAFAAIVRDGVLTNISNIPVFPCKEDIEAFIELLKEVLQALKETEA